jgi:hypothetical protein
LVQPRFAELALDVAILGEAEAATDLNTDLISQVLLRSRAGGLHDRPRLDWTPPSTLLLAR